MAAKVVCFHTHGRTANMQRREFHRSQHRVVFARSVVLESFLFLRIPSLLRSLLPPLAGKIITKGNCESRAQNKSLGPCLVIAIVLEYTWAIFVRTEKLSA
jgi:hypothetical protein